MANKQVGTQMMKEMHEVAVEEGTYPQLDGLEDGAKFSAKVQGTVSKGEEGMTLKFSMSDIQTENKADKEMKKMMGKKMEPQMETEEGEEE